MTIQELRDALKTVDEYVKVFDSDGILWLRKPVKYNNHLNLSTGRVLREQPRTVGELRAYIDEETYDGEVFVNYEPLKRLEFSSDGLLLFLIH